MTGRSSLLHCRSGTAAVEMVLVMPFLAMLLFGAVEIGHYFHNQHQVVKGVRDGARFASRLSMADLKCDETPDPEAVTAIKEITRTGQIAGGTPRVRGWVNEDVEVTVTCASAITTGIYKNEENGAPQITVRASFAYDPLFDDLLERLGVFPATIYLDAEQQAAGMGI